MDVDTVRAGAAKPITAREFDAVFRAECGYVWTTLRRLGVRDADVEDVAHEVFVAVYRKLHEFDPSRPIRPWLFGFAYREASAWRRTASVRREVPSEIPDAVDERPQGDALLEAARRSRLVHAALGTIERERKAVLILHDIDGYPVPEVAAALGVPLNTAYSRLRLARADFAAAVRRLQHTMGEP